jgi:hypothetical protein
MPKVEILDGYTIGVGPGEGDEIILQMQNPMTGDIVRISLGTEAAQTIGKGLLAPRVQQPAPQQIVLPR